MPCAAGPDPISVITDHGCARKTRWEERHTISVSAKAARLLLAPAKRAATKGLFSAITIAAATLVTARMAKASTVTVTVTGTVTTDGVPGGQYSGTDYTGVFGFAPGTSLVGQRFTLVFTIDDTGGTVTVTNCSGVPCVSIFQYQQNFPTPVQMPATAVLQIGSGSWTFGRLPGEVFGGSFEGDRVLSGPYLNNISFILGDTSEVMSEIVDIDAVQPQPGANIIPASYSWEGVFADPNLYNPPNTVSSEFSIEDIQPKAYLAGGYLLPTSITISGPEVANPAAKNLGGCGCPGGKGPSNPSSGGPNPDNDGQASVGEPITIGSGNLFEQVTDYRATGPNALDFTRYYNSLGNAIGMNSYASTLGTNWRSNYDRYLHIGAASVVVERPNGQQLTFTQNGSSWIADSDVDVTLAQSGSSWTLTDHDDTVEIYNQVTGTLNGVSTTYGQLASITKRNGYTQTLGYSGVLLTSVTDSYGRSLGFTYSSGLLTSVTTPDTLVLSYGTTAVSTGGHQLTSVSYNTTPATGQTYLYENATFTFALTGIKDEDDNRFATWTYDGSGRATSSQHGAGADFTTVAYNINGSTTVTNALGVADTYTFTTLQNVPKVTQISRAATPTTAAATETFIYDANGYLASQTDWNSNQTTYVNNAHGEPTTINEAVGATAARTTTIAYDPTFVHLPDSITTPGLTTSFTYDATGNVLTKTLTDTTTTTLPYATTGQTRTTTNTWSNYLLASVKTPIGNTTKFGYDSTGALTSTTDPLNHITQITSHTGGGLPLTIVDPNSVTTMLTYDARQRPTSSTVSGTSGTFETTWAYDAAGNLITTTLPDGSFLTNGYDTAHRLIKVTDALGSYTSYTLDALGDRTRTSIFKSGATLTWQDSADFDAFGRLLADTAGAGQVTTRSFDPMGNVLSVEDGLGHATTNTYDALNRLSASSDPNGGVTTPTYDAHDRVISVTDANSNTTSYTRNGFGDVIQQSSPDSGVTVLHYDGDANLTSKTDALGIVTNQTFDALDRPLTTTYPGDTTENVSYTYDQTGTAYGFGVGKLTSVTDTAGSLTRAYDERGNLGSETRVNGSKTLVTAYTYDGANRVASLTYPDGTLVTYAHDAAGYLTTVGAKLPGASTSTTLATLAHLPFGPQNGVTYGSGTAETWSYDQAYRATNIKDVLSSVTGQNLTYTYDNADNVKSITDAVNAANSQTLGYDAVNRLTSATSGSGGYGSFAWTYDKVGNRLTQVQGATTTSYGYAPGTNRLASITTATTHAALGAAPFAWSARSRGRSFAMSHAPETARPQSVKLPNIDSRSPRPWLVGLLGWPMLLTGFAGIFSLRRRLRTNALLAVLCGAALLTGGVALLNGCSSHTDSTPATVTVSAPTFSPPAGSYTATQSVTISDSTAGSSIYYTTNGTTPTTGSALYAGPIAVSSSESLEAIGVASGDTNSPVATAAYTINIPIAATPTFSVSGGIYTSVQTVAISDTTSGSQIYYTTNGTTPTTASALYSGAITVSASETIQAIAVASGYANSAVARASYTITFPQAATPTYSVAGGTYTSAQTVALSDGTSGASVYYTTNGTAPTTSSTLYTGPILVAASETVQAIAVVSGYTNSAAATAAYTIALAAATPTFSPPAGAYGAAQTVIISDTTAGATIYYTTNGSTPTVSSTAYTGPITVSTTETLSAIALAAGGSASAIGTAAYTITPPAATPTFSPVAGTYGAVQTLTISSTTSGTSIYYTTNGTTPTTASTLYAGPITVAASETIEAIAVTSGYATSAVGSSTYTINLPAAATPAFSVPGGTYTSSQAVSISDATAGASIYYTTNGTTPTTSSTLYTGPISVSTSETLEAIAVASGFTTSPTATAVYTISISVVNTITTNANGNITSIPPADSAAYATFGYNNANRLSSVTGTPIAATFVYDWAGQRFSKTNPGMTPTVYIYDQSGTTIAENDGGTVSDYVYADGRPIAIIQPNATPAANQINYVVADRMGTPQLVTNSSGSSVWSTTYQPFGTTNLVNATINQNLRFPGQLADSETSFSYNLNRDYMPNLGRYLETDPVGLDGGMNTYGYVGGNPVKQIDRRGLETTDINDPDEAPAPLASPVIPIPDRDIPLSPIQQASGAQCPLAQLSQFRDFTDQLGDTATDLGYLGLPTDSRFFSALSIGTNGAVFYQDPTLNNFLPFANSIASLYPPIAVGEGALSLLGVNPPWIVQKK